MSQEFVAIAGSVTVLFPLVSETFPYQSPLRGIQLHPQDQNRRQIQQFRRPARHA